MTHMAKPESSNSKHGCFSGFLRVLLCAGNGTSPPVYPSDHVEEKTQQLHHPKKNKLFLLDNEKEAEATTSTTTTPGVVARLMGLDSLPNTNWGVKRGGSTTPDSVPRSKSVNFVDYLLKFDPSHANNNNHRRVNSSASFREVPSLNHVGDGLIVVLDQEYGARLRKNDMGMGELKQRKRQGSGSKSKEIVVVDDVGVKKKERNNNNNNNNNQGGGKKKKNKKISKLRNEPRRVPSTSKNSSKVQNLSSSSSSEGKDLNKSCDCGYYYRYSDGGAGSSSSPCSSLPNRHNKKGLVEVEPKINTNMRNQQYSTKKIETKCSLENLSPVSVLDINHYPFLYGTGFLESTGTIASKSKWKSLMPLSLDDGVDEKASNNKGYASTDVNREAEYYSELMRKLRTLTEKDMRESDCTSKRVCETDHQGFEEICSVFEHKIFDLLLNEVVNELL